MDLGTSITAILIAIACIIPFIIMNKINARRERQFLQPLFSLAQNHHSRVSQYDTWSNAAVGIDYHRGMVFFFKKIDNTEVSRQVTLSEIRKCRIVQVTKTASDEPDNFKPIAKIELTFEHLDKTKPDTILEFYNADADGGTLTGELQLVEKWRLLINNKMAAK